uniref:Phosphoglucomutase 2-like 1 n=1 Tax=Sinocyclocheilus rhinocerous TaxID=307959 RepID=A0A673FTB9_9TELE
MFGLIGSLFCLGCRDKLSNPQTRKQMESLVREGHVVELRRRLCSRMTFGTAGLRAEMGAGFACINDLTVIQFVKNMYLFFLCRLARLTAAVMLCKDIPVYLFSTYVPTPFVPYAVMKYEAAAGVMITASHNRKEDNGYQVYWHNGAQISSPHDKEILHCIEENTEPWPESWNEHLVESSLLRRDPLEDVCRWYMEELNTICFHRELNAKSPLKFVHSSFHGVGHNYVQRAFQQFGFPHPIPVPEQKDPDPDFSTVSCPNPEEGESVLELSLRLAEREEAHIVVATDPDADRLAVAERNGNFGWKVFTGNELAALLGWWMLFNWKEAHPDPADTEIVYMLATTVSSKILKALTLYRSCPFETLPGFKWIGKRIHELTKTGKEVIFSFEESIVSTATVVAEMAAYLHTKNLSLNQQLINIYEMYGYHVSRTSYVLCSDPLTIHTLFSRLRNFGGPGDYPELCGDYCITHIRDVTTGYDSSQPDKKCMSKHQMVTFTFQNGIVATLRTSGTEPKIKYYTEFCAVPGERFVSSIKVSK